MMTVEALRVCPVETAEFVDLGLHDVLEGTDEPWVKHDLSETVPQQVPGQLLLAFHKPHGTPRRRKWRRKVEVQSRVNPPFPGHHRGSRRILHEDHGTH
jgi:hypothetical protein